MFNNKNLRDYFDFIEALLIFIIVLILDFTTHIYFFFIPLSILLLLNLIQKGLKIMYKILSEKNNGLSLKIAKILERFYIRGIVFYFFASILLGFIITYWKQNTLGTNIIVIILIAILLLIGFFLDFKKNIKLWR